MKILDMFPIPSVWENLAQEVDKEEIERILKASSDKNKWNNNLGNNYLHPDWYILDHYAPKLKAIITDRVNKYLNDVWGEEGKLRVTISWLNFNPKHSHHHTHSHPNSVFSGCFYIKNPPNSGDILLKNPNNRKTLYSRKKVSNKYNGEMFGFNPEEYDLFIFPSWMEHMVTENKSNSYRVSLAFNTFYTGKIGVLEEATELDIGWHG